MSGEVNKINQRPQTGRVWLLFTMLLLLTAISPIATAEINKPDKDEQANIDAAINAIDDLIKKCEEKGRSCASLTWINQAKTVLQNLKDLNRTGKIKSVPGLDDDSSKKLRYENGNPASPLGAFCPPTKKTEIYNTGSGEWEICPPGTIIFDSSLFASPTDKTSLDAWDNLWRLADVLWHEKMHEHKFPSQADLDTARDAADADSAQSGHHPGDEHFENKRLENQNEIVDRALNKHTHGLIYKEQIRLVTVHRKLIQKEIYGVRDEIRAEKVKAVKEELEAKKEELEAKKKLLKKRLSTLRNSRSKALSNHFDEFYQNESCHLPSEPTDGVLSVHVLYPDIGYTQYGFLYENGTGVNFSIVEEGFADEVEQLDPLLGVPTSWLVMSDETFTEMVQPDNCENTDSLVESGNITVLTSESELFNHVPRGMTFSFIDGFGDRPLEGVTVKMYDSAGNMIAEFDPGENNNSEFVAILPPDGYYFEVSTEVFWIDIVLQETRVISSSGDADHVIIRVDLYIIPVEYLPSFIYVLISVFVLLGALRFNRWRLGGKQPRYFSPTFRRGEADPGPADGDASVSDKIGWLGEIED